MHVYKGNFQYGSTFSLWEVLVRVHLALKKITLQEQQIKVLIYFCMYGINSDTNYRMLNEKAIPSAQIIRNAKTVLKEKKLIFKEEKRWKLSSPLNDLEILDGVINILVKCKTH